MKYGANHDASTGVCHSCHDEEKIIQVVLVVYHFIPRLATHQYLS
jgi:hypothetical protein